MGHLNQGERPIVLKRIFLSITLVLSVSLPATVWAQKGTIKIAVQAPLSGEQAALGEHIKLGAQLAVEEATKPFKALGLTWSSCLTTIKPNPRSASPTPETSLPIRTCWF